MMFKKNIIIHNDNVIEYSVSQAKMLFLTKQREWTNHFCYKD